MCKCWTSCFSHGNILRHLPFRLVCGHTGRHVRGAGCRHDSFHFRHALPDSSLCLRAVWKSSRKQWENAGTDCLSVGRNRPVGHYVQLVSGVGLTSYKCMFRTILQTHLACLLYLNAFFNNASFFVSSAYFLDHSDIAESLFVIILNNSSLVYAQQGVFFEYAFRNRSILICNSIMSNGDFSSSASNATYGITGMNLYAVDDMSHNRLPGAHKSKSMSPANSCSRNTQL